MDWSSFALLVCSLGVVGITFIQQRQQGEEALKTKDIQLKQKEEIISEFKNLITGGNSFLYLNPVKGTNEVLFLLQFKGKYPLYDTSILIEEFDLNQVRSNTFQYQKINERVISMGTVNPLQHGSLFKINLPINSNLNTNFGKKFFLKITSRNGMVEEDVHIRLKGSQFSIAYKIVFFEPDYSGNLSGLGIGGIKRKIRHIDSLFPVNELEHLDGDSGWKPSYEIQTGLDLN